MKRISYIIAAAAVLCACNKEQTFERSNGGLMTIDISTSEMTATRGTLYGSSSLASSSGPIDSVNLYVFNNTNALESGAPTGTKYKDSKWNVIDYYWPSTKTLGIFARMPYNLGNKVVMGNPSYTFSTGVVSFDYNIPNNTSSTDMPDLMVAHNKKTGSSVDLSLKHALTALQFKTGTSISPMTIDSLVIKQINNSGTCTFNTSATSPTPTIGWNSLSGSVNYSYKPTTAISVSLNTSVDIATGNNSFIIIPQSINSNDVIYLYFKPDGKDTHTVRGANLNQTLEPGKIYTFSLNYQEDILSVSGISAENWITGTSTSLELHPW